MHMSSLRDRPLRKIARAEMHFADALSKMEAWAKENPITARNVVSQDRRRINAILAVESEPPLNDVSLAVGDAVHNLRSALDALTWNLAHLGGAPERPRDIQFPVASTEKQWKEASRKLASLPEMALAQMLSFQPWPLEAPEVSFLGILHDLDIRDKHHDFLTSHGQVYGVDLKARFGVDSETTMGPLEAFPRLPEINGATLATIPFSNPLSDVVEPEGAVQFAISFSVEVYDDLSLDLSLMAEMFPKLTTAIVMDVCDGL